MREKAKAMIVREGGQEVMIVREGGEQAMSEGK